jgi:hypothetical protein
MGVSKRTSNNKVLRVTSLKGKKVVEDGRAIKTAQHLSEGELTQLKKTSQERAFAESKKRVRPAKSSIHHRNKTQIPKALASPKRRRGRNRKKKHFRSETEHLPMPTPYYGDINPSTPDDG